MHPHKSPMLWIPSLYFAKGMPYVVVTVLSLLLLRQLGLGLGETTLLVACFYLPWVLKPWWKPWVVHSLSCRSWVLLTELLLMLSFSSLAFVVGMVPVVFCLLLLIATLTALHNVAVDELYRRELTDDVRHAYRHVRELSRKLAVAVGQGVIVMLVGNLQVLYRYNIGFSWSLMFYLLAGIFLVFFLWHLYAVPSLGVVLPSTTKTADASLPASAVIFLLCYGLAPAFQSKVSILFLVEPLRNGGLGLSPQEFGLVMGSLGIFALIIGGLLGTKFIERVGLRSALWPMAVAMLVPSAIYCFLSSCQPSYLFVVSCCIFAEQLAYGFGFAAYLVLLGRLHGGELKKSLMALSLMLPCALSGLLAEQTDYHTFFILTLLVGLASLASVHVVRRDDALLR